jgi:NADPH:quinone reductase-like Zn-dependent oxidoreductase
MRGTEAQLDMSLVLRERLQIKGSVMRTRSLSDKRMMTARFIERWLPLFLSGAIHPVIDKVFNFTDVVAAHEYIESNQNVGKVVLVW